MSNIRRIPLRILYTINSSPQYILARSHALIPVVPVLYNQNDRNDNPISAHYDTDEVSTAHSLDQPPIYATASLKICLDTICRSSPELVQDNSRDFSVYVLDPLESNSAPAPVHIANSNSCSSGVPSTSTTQAQNSTSDQPRGVAVGLGLMSWALLADESDSVTVAGTLIKLGTGREALEVIFALRETTPMQKASLPAAVRSWGLPPEPSSKRTRVHASKSHRQSKHPSSNTTNANTNPIPQQHSLPHVPPTATAAGPPKPVHLPSHQPYPRPQDQGITSFQRNVFPPGSSSTDINANPISSCHALTSTSTSTSTFNPIPAPTSSPSHPSSTFSTTLTTRSKSKQQKPKPKPKPKTTRPPSEVEKLLDASAMYLGPPKRKGRPKAFRGGVGTENGEPNDGNEDIMYRDAVSSRSDLGYNGDKHRDEVVIETPTSCDGEASTDLASGNSLSARPSSTSAGVNTVAASSATTTTTTSANTKAKSKKKLKLTADHLSPPFVSTPLIRQPPDSNPAPSNTDTDPDRMTLLDILGSLSTSTSSNEPSTQNAALLAALGSIDSAAGVAGPSSVADGKMKGEANSALVNALRQLLSACSRQAPSSSDNQCSHSHQQTPVKSSCHSQDDEIVLLDKENVNPTAFRRRAERERADAKLLGMSPPFSRDSVESSNVTAGRTITGTSAGLGISMRSNDNSSPTSAPVPSSSSSNTNTNTRRKRRLSDFMDERESGSESRRNREKAGRRDAHRHVRRNSSENDMAAFRHQPHSRNEKVTRYHRTGMEMWTSPPRHDSENSRRHPMTVPESPRAPRVSASSPVRSSFVQSQSCKRYVVPEWARTNTATQPRLSKEAERAVVEAEERKREEKEAGKKRTAAHAKEVERGKRKSFGHDTRASGIETRNQNQANKSGSISSMPPPPPKPIAASSGFPVFGAADLSPSTLPASSPPSRPVSRSPSWSPSPTTTKLPLPSTPPQKRRANAFSTPGVEGSLFTPTPKSWSGRGLGDVGGAAGSPLFSPRAGFGFGSPLRNGQTTQLSPIQAVVMGRNIVGGDAGWGGRGREGMDGWTEPQSGEADRHEPEVDDLDDMLSRELGSALEDLDFPPSSLPTASSDIDIDAYPSHTLCDGASEDLNVGRDDDQEEHGHTMKQHWSGLPPSSPPPPTSPLLMPQYADPDAELRTDAEEMVNLDSEFPLATSDTEYGYLDSELTPDSADELASYSAEELAMYFNMNHFSTLSSTPVQSYSDSQDHHDNTSSDVDVFEQFTNHHAQSDGPETPENVDMSMDQGLDPIIQNGLVDFDFTEFWESVKPLVEDNVDINVNSNPHADLGLNFGMHGGDSQDVGMSELDHTRLAEEVHALFSGCLM